MAANFNIIALDVGERRVGVAIANSVAKLSSPLVTLDQSGNIYKQVEEIIRKENIKIIILGLPRNLNGEETKQTKYVREFAEKLKVTIDMEIYFEDEALSSVRAKEGLESSGKQYQKADIDSLAACYILDDFMSNNKEVVNA